MEPRRFVMFDPVQRRRTEVIDLRGSQGIPEHPERLECDFCNRESTHLWGWWVKPFRVEVWEAHVMDYRGGRWIACESCRPLVAARDLKGLVARVCAVNQVAAELPAEYLPRLYGRVFNLLEEPPVEWNSRDHWPIRGPEESEAAR